MASMAQLPTALLEQIARGLLRPSPRGHENFCATSLGDTAEFSIDPGDMQRVVELAHHRLPAVAWVPPRKRAPRQGTWRQTWEEDYWLLQHTRELLAAVRAVRLVCRQWRDIFDYKDVPFLHLDNVQIPDNGRAAGRLPADFSVRFRGCERVHLRTTLHDPRWAAIIPAGERQPIPDALRGLSSLRVLDIDCGCYEDIVAVMPNWLADIPLTALLLRAGSGLNHSQLRNPSAWRLPPTLTSLRFDGLKCEKFPSFIRKLVLLQELDFGQMFSPAHDVAVPQWVLEMPLRRLTLKNVALRGRRGVESLRVLPLEALSIGHEYDRTYNILEDQASHLVSLQKMMAGTPIAASLRELSLESHGLAEVPTCLRQLRLLERLNLGGNEINLLPEWLGELPLVLLELVRRGHYTAICPVFASGVVHTPALYTDYTHDIVTR